MVNESAPFAMALLEIGQENDSDTSLLGQLEELDRVYQENPDLVKLMDAPTVQKEQKLSVLKELFGNSLNETMMHFLQVLVQHRMAGKIPQITSDFIRLYNAAHGIEVVRITSASPLDEEQKNRLKEMLEKKLNHQVELELAVDPSLIAGLRIETENATMDNSYAARLSTMKEQLQKG